MNKSLNKLATKATKILKRDSQKNNQKIVDRLLEKIWHIVRAKTNNAKNCLQSKISFFIKQLIPLFHQRACNQDDLP